MQTLILDLSPQKTTALPRGGLSVRDHPVFQALPPRVQTRIQSTGQLQRLAAGAGTALDAKSLHFVLSGVLGLFPDQNQVCVSIVAAGAVHGWDQALEPLGTFPAARPLLDCLVFTAPSCCVTETLGRDWLVRLVAFQAPQRLRFLEAEAACNARHSATERLAKWLVRLHDGGNGAPLRLTQADLGRILGVQRTSISTAASRLQSGGLVRFARGKARITNLTGLKSASCGCGAPCATTRSPLSKTFEDGSPWAPASRAAQA